MQKIATKYHTTVLLLLICTLAALSQNNYNHQFERISIETSSPQFEILSFYQDSLNYLWIGTTDGLICFDGTNTTSYQKQENTPHKLHNNKIHVITGAPNNNLWIGTENGLYYYQRNKASFKAIKLHNTLTDQAPHIRTLYLEGKTLWIGTYGNGLIKYNTQLNTTTTYTNLNKLCGNKINAFTAENSNSFWIGTENKGLSHFNPKTEEFTNYFWSAIPGEGLNDSTINDLYYNTTENKLYIATWDGGINILNRENNTFSYLCSNDKNTSQIPLKTVRTLQAGKENKLWCGTFGDGLIELNTTNNSYQQYSANDATLNAISNNFIWTSYKDNSETIWIGSTDGSISKIDPLKSIFTHYSANSNKNNWLHNNKVTAICEDQHNNIWIGTSGGGLYYFNPIKNTFARFFNHNFHASAHIRSIMIDNLSNVWAATDNGLYIKSTSNDSFVRYSSNYNINSAYSLTQDQQLGIWIGTFNNGLYKVSSINHAQHHVNCEEFKLQPNTATNGTNRIWCTYHLNDSNLWVGTDAGLYLLNSENKRATKIFDRSTSSITQIAPQQYAIGTLNGGLYTYNSLLQKFEQINLSYSQATNVIIGLITDKHKNLWATTRNGLIKLNTRNNAVNIFWGEQGLPGDDYNLNSYYKLENGNIIIGGNKGFSIFTPHAITPDTTIPAVQISKLTINGRLIYTSPKEDPAHIDLSEKENTQFKHNENNITIEFVSPQHTMPHKVRYTYKLLGIDTTWHATFNQNSKAKYANLPPGNYTFQVKSTNHHGIKHNKPTELNFSISPPFWSTYWFLLSLIISLIAIAYIATKLVVKRVKKKLKDQEQKYKIKQLIQEKELIQSKNDRLKSEVNLTVMSILAKNSKLMEVRERINYLNPFVNKEGKKKLDKLTAYIQEELNNKEDWQQFEKRFNLAHDNFLTRLSEKHPELSSVDLRFCAYLKTKLSNEDIANLTNHTIRGVETARTRIRKRLNLKREQNLNQFIEEL